MCGGVGRLCAHRRKNMTDLHCHVLPGFDDGARSLEVSLAMLKQAADAGTTDLVASPHADYRYPYDRQRVVTAIAELQNLHPGPLAFIPAATFICTSKTFNCSSSAPNSSGSAPDLIFWLSFPTMVRPHP
jgi:hypothetical protein